MAAMSQSRPLRTGVLSVLWLVAGVVVIMHVGLQYITPVARGSDARASEGTTRKSMASGNERLASRPDQGSLEKEAAKQESSFGGSLGALLTGMGALALVGATITGGAAPAQALAEGEEPVFSQWAGAVSEGFTREKEDKNMGFLATNQSLAPISHNLDLLNGSPQKLIQATLPFAAMGAVSYYSTNKDQTQS